VRIILCIYSPTTLFTLLSRATKAAFSSSRVVLYLSHGWELSYWIVELSSDDAQKLSGLRLFCFSAHAVYLS
jgi:hypothetical protein